MTPSGDAIPAADETPTDGSRDGTPSGNGPLPADETPTDDIALKEYFLEIASITNANNERTSEVVSEFDANLGTAPTDDEAIAAYEGMIEGISTILRLSFDDVEDIDSPAEVENAHGRLTNALGNQLRVFVDFGDAIAGVRSVPELEETVAEFDPATTDADKHVTDACFELQAIANGEGIDVDLRCEE